MGRVMGEVLYVVKCRAKIVEFRRTSGCYHELPITYENNSRFMMPITRIIQVHGTEIDCGSKLPPMFYLDGKWLEADPSLRHSATNPITLNANSNDETVPMMKVAPISAHGVYTQEEMEAFQQTLLFPNERRAITNMVSRRVAGITANTQGFHLPNVFTEGEFSNMAWKAAEEVWGFMSRLGNIFSTITLAYFIFSILRYCLSVILNFFKLRKAANNQPRPRLFLWASLWDSLTQLLLIKHLQPHTTTSASSATPLEDSLPSQALSPPVYLPPDHVQALRQPINPNTMQIREHVSSN